MSRPVLIAQKSHAAPAPDALRVIEQLKNLSATAGADAAEIRRQYTQSRRLLIGTLDAVGGIVSIPADGNRPSLTVLRPLGSGTGPLPALLYFHGGGWTVGSLETYEPFCRKLANATGCAVVWVEYRLAPEHPFPAAYDDARAAYRWVLDNATILGLDPARIGVAGDSSGGNLAAALCLAERDDRSSRLPWAQVLIYPCLDMSACLKSHKFFATGYGLTAETYRWYRQNYASNVAKPVQWRLSPLFVYDVEGLPPTVILYAGFDILRDEAAAYANRLDDAGVPLQRLYFPDMIHGFITLGGAIAAADTAIDRIAAALRGLTEPEAGGYRLVHH